MPERQDYMHPRQREAIVDRALQTALVCLQDDQRDPSERIRTTIQAIKEHQRYIAYCQKLDQRKERLANAKRTRVQN